MVAKQVVRGRRASAKKVDAQSRAEHTRELILESSAKLFRTQGYAATTLRQIAKAAKIKAGSIYYHFKSKDEVLQEILSIGVSDAREAAKNRIDALGREARPREKIESAMLGHLEGLLRHGGEFSSATIRVYGHLPPHLKKQNQELRKDYGKVWDELFAEAAQSGQLRQDLSLGLARLIVVGAINWTTEWFDPKQDNFDDVARQVVSILSEGIFKKSSKKTNSEGVDG